MSRQGFVLALPIGLGGALGYWATKYNREVFTPAYARWQLKFMCDRCGEIFTM